MNDLTVLLTVLTALAATVWGATEGLGRIFRWRKDRVALVLGPLSGAVAHGAGFLELGGHGAWDWIAAAFFGALATLAAGAAHDYLVKPALPAK